MADSNIREALSLTRILRRNLAEFRLADHQGQIVAIFPQSNRNSIDNALDRLELLLGDPASLPVEVVETISVPVFPGKHHHVSDVAQSEAPASPASGIRSAANVQRDAEIQAAYDAAKLATVPAVQGQNQPVSAVGVNRDIVSRTPNIKHYTELAPDSENRTNNTFLPIIEGINKRPLSPFERLTEVDSSEFYRLFTKSPFLEHGGGVIGIPSKDFPWAAARDPEKMAAIDVLKLNTGFYGRNQETGGPKVGIIRSKTCLILWNLGSGNESVRVFYVGRSNVHGYWLYPNQLTTHEQLSVVASIVDLRREIHHRDFGGPAPVAKVRH